jgi:hypothetical protein
MSKNLRVSFRHNRSAWLVFGPAFVALVFTAALAFFSATTSTEAAAATWSGRTETYAGFAGGLERGGYMRILISPVDNPLFNNNMVLLGVNGNNDVGSTGYSQSGTNGGLFIRYGPNFSNVKKIATLEGSEKSFSAAFDNNGDLHVVLAISRFKYYRLDSNLNIIVNGEPILDGDCRPEEIRCEYPSLVYHSGQNRLFMAYNEYKQRGIIPDNWHNVVAVNVAPGNPFQGVSNGTQISDSSTYRPRVPYLTATPDGNLYMGIYQRDQLNTANLFYITPNGSGGWNKSAFIRNGISNVRIATDRNGSLALYRELGNKRGVATALTTLGDSSVAIGDYSRATGLLEESLKLKREMGDKIGIAFSLLSLGRAALYRDKYDQADTLCHESLKIRLELSDRRGVAEGLECLAGIAAARGKPHEAARLFGAAEALREAINAPLPPSDRPYYDGALGMAKMQLDNESFDKAWQEGRNLKNGELTRLALG